MIQVTNEVIRPEAVIDGLRRSSHCSVVPLSRTVRTYTADRALPYRDHAAHRATSARADVTLDTPAPTPDPQRLCPARSRASAVARARSMLDDSMTTR